MAIHASLPFQQYGRSYRTMFAVSCWIILIVGIAVIDSVTAEEEEETNDSIAAVFEAVDVPTGEEEIPCVRSFFVSVLFVCCFNDDSSINRIPLFTFHFSVIFVRYCCGSSGYRSRRLNTGLWESHSTDVYRGSVLRDDHGTLLLHIRPGPGLRRLPQ